MEKLPYKQREHTGADSFGVTPPLGGGHLSLWFPTQQDSHRALPNSGDDTKTEYHNSYVKLSEARRYQEQDSSSTLSTGQSDLEAATSGFIEIQEKGRDNCEIPFLSNGNADYLSHQVRLEHHNQPLDSVSYPFAGPYSGRIYEPSAVAYPQMMGMAPTRPVLPLDCTEGIFPIYVNAKQYHAILRRRQTRAKLEARNKMIKSRKPYLHESRHLHALKRVRGSGGRFLNTKSMPERKATVDKKPVSENNSWADPTTSGSDVSCVFNNDDIFTQPDLGVSIDSLTRPDNRLALSIDGYRQIDTGI